MTQTEAVLLHMRTRGAITPLEALDLYGCFRLGARIYDLKREGYDIHSELVQRNGKQFSRYTLRGQSDLFESSQSNSSSTPQGSQGSRSAAVESLSNISSKRAIPATRGF